jgi:hypothetical protein
MTINRENPGRDIRLRLPCCYDHSIGRTVGRPHRFIIRSRTPNISFNEENLPVPLDEDNG